MNNVNTETFRQFNAIAPRVLNHSGRNFKRKSALYCDDTNTVNFYFHARKRPTDLIASTIAVRVKYDRGSDLYNIEIDHGDGCSLAHTTIKSFDQMYGDSFERLNSFI